MACEAPSSNEPSPLPSPLSVRPVKYSNSSEIRSPGPMETEHLMKLSNGSSPVEALPSEAQTTAQILSRDGLTSFDSAKNRVGDFSRDNEHSDHSIIPVQINGLCTEREAAQVTQSNGCNVKNMQEETKSRDSITPQRAQNEDDCVDGVDGSHRSTMPLSVASPDRNLKAGGARPEESFRLVNEELQSMFSTPAVTITKKLAKKNPSAPAGSLAFDTARRVAQSISSAVDKTTETDQSSTEKYSAGAAIRNHPPLKASRSMYIVGPSLYREIEDTREKLSGLSKNVEMERSSTIDEEDSASSSDDNEDDLPEEKTLQAPIATGEDVDQGINETKQTDKILDEHVSDDKSEAGTENIAEMGETLVATPTSVHIYISTIESPRLEHREQIQSSLFETYSCQASLASSLSPVQFKRALPSVSPPVSRVPSPTSFVRPPSPPARSVTPVSPVASIPCLASIEELDRSISQDDEAGSDYGLRKEKDRLGQTHYEHRFHQDARRSSLNLDSSVEVHQYKANSLTATSALPERRHSAAEAISQESRSSSAMGFVEAFPSLPKGDNAEVKLLVRSMHEVVSKSRTGEKSPSDREQLESSSKPTGESSSNSQRRKRLVKRRSDLRSFDKSEGSSDISDSENITLNPLNENEYKTQGSSKGKAKERAKQHGHDDDVNDPNGAMRFMVQFPSQSKKTQWRSSLSDRLEEHRHKILTQKSVKASGVVLLKETRRKKVKQLSNFFSNVAYTLAPWGKSIRDIEGHHGAGVASYFLFLRWLFGFNILLFLLMTAFIVIPMRLIGDSPLSPSTTNSIVNTSYYCSVNYTVVEHKGVSYLLEFIQGTGWMEKTLVFQGYYVTNLSGSYNLPLAYVLTVLTCMLVSLAMMARYTSKSFEAALLNSIDTNFEYSNKVFGAWDYGLTDEEAAKLKQKGIHYDLQSEMMEQSFMRTRMERLENKCAMFKLYTVRLVINLLIIFLLGAAAYAIVKVTSWSTSYVSSNTDATGMDEWLLLLVQYLPSLTITACNALLPLVFELIVELEDYSQAFIIKITLIRTVFLRLASIIVLLITLFTEITCGPVNDCRTTVEPACSDIRCWESYVGQQLYKLVILDFVVAVVKVFAVEIPRKILAEKCTCGLIQKIGPPEFNITSNVLDLIYGQCLIWLGLLFCPLLPGLMVVKSFIMFFVKKVSAMFACPPSEKPYRASRINTFFMIILLLTYFLCAVPVLYGIFGIHPSRGCGPFRLLDYMNEAIENAVDEWPLFLSNTYDLFTSAAFSGTIIILLLMIIYYLNTMSKAHNQRANLLKEQLIMEGRDKQYLLNKLQEQDKKMDKRKTDPSPAKKGSQPKQRASENVSPDRHNQRSNDPGEGSFSPPHYVDNPEW